jgi:hypothetical protein
VSPRYKGLRRASTRASSDYKNDYFVVFFGSLGSAEQFSGFNLKLLLSSEVFKFRLQLGLIVLCAAWLVS